MYFGWSSYLTAAGEHNNFQKQVKPHEFKHVILNM